MDPYDEAALYAAAFDWPVDAEVAWLLDRVPGAHSVLEPMCGNARYGPAFADRGVVYTGLDRSRALLARAPSRPGVTVHLADACAFSVPGGPFDLAWCPINSIRHLAGPDDIHRHLGRVRAHLADAAPYVVEIELSRRDGPFAGGPDDKSRWSMEQPDGSVIEAEWRPIEYDRARGRSRERASLRRRPAPDADATAELTHVYEMRTFTWDEWRAEVERAGFRIDAAFVCESAHGRPAVTPSAALEDTGRNVYFFLRAATGRDP